MTDHADGVAAPARDGPQVEILSEVESSGRWTFTASVQRAGEPLAQHQVRLAWPDYDVLCPDGAAPPEAAARALLCWLLERERDTPGWRLPPAVDAAMPRRRWPGADAAIRALVIRAPGSFMPPP